MGSENAKSWMGYFVILYDSICTVYNSEELVFESLTEVAFGPWQFFHSSNSDHHHLSSLAGSWTRF